MAREKKLEAPITLFATIEARQHEALRTIAFSERRSIADVVREAIEKHIRTHPRHTEPVRVTTVGEKKVAAVRHR